MERLKSLRWQRSRFTTWVILAALVLALLLIYRLGSLVGGLSGTEIKAATEPVGPHGIWNNPQYLPLKLVRTVVFDVFPNHGQTLTRLPNVIFGAAAVASFSWLIWLWHGRRTAIFTTILFAAGAWTLHASRLASFDVVYLWATPMLLIIQALLYRHSDNRAVWYGALLTWLLLLFVPGMIWLIAIQLVLQYQIILKAWASASRRRRAISVTLPVLAAATLAFDLVRSGHMIQWLGLPAHWDSLGTLIKHFVAVPVHLFIRGPQYPEIWLGRAPILDAFVLLAAVLGVYFYAKHWRAWRSRTLGTMFAAGWILVAIGGPVGLSLLVPLLYVAAAAGLAYLLHEWLKVFPLNPLARGLGIGLISLLVALSCLYNLKAYFVAWPHNQATKATFRYHR
jgi:hypothetical protein